MTHLTLKKAQKMMQDNGGYLDLRGTGITVLPEGLSVGGYLDLEGTGITVLPEGLVIPRGLYMEATKIKRLPKSLKVGADVVANSSYLSEIPEGVISKGSALHLSDTPITSLPNGLVISSLFIDNTKLVDFPSDLVIEPLTLRSEGKPDRVLGWCGTLFLEGTPNKVVVKDFGPRGHLYGIKVGNAEWFAYDIDLLITSRAEAIRFFEANNLEHVVAAIKAAGK